MDMTIAMYIVVIFFDFMTYYQMMGYAKDVAASLISFNASFDNIGRVFFCRANVFGQSVVNCYLNR